MRHLLRIADLSDAEIQHLCLRAATRPPQASQVDPGRSAVALMFLEPSTRTRISFERAAQYVGRPSIVFDAKSTSLEKGESLEDTILTLRALKISTFVIRTSQTDGLESLRKIPGVSLVNAGDGVGEHPTQALLDAATLLREWAEGDISKLRGLRLGILGDLRRSRVARSWAVLAAKLGIELVLISPPEWKPANWGQSLTWSSDKTEALKSLDVVMALRVQKERMDSHESAQTEAFVKNFQLRPEDLTPSQKLMHPGPVNWGVELSSAFQTDPRSLILKQVEMGLAMRACVLDFLDDAP